jgi:hypothetical protein
LNIFTFTVVVGLASCIAGLVGALTGIGGGVVIVPLLVMTFGVDIRYAIGASLVSVIATSSGAAAAYVREGYSNIRVAMFLEIATTLGALSGDLTFTTVSDDPGLDAHEGTITCVKTSEDGHGFVRHSADRPAAWRYDDGGAVQSEGTVAVLGRAALCGSAGDPCTESVSLPRDSVDVSRLQAADRLVTEALAAGRVAEIGLFDAGDAGSIDGPRMYRYIEYMTARYAAFPNVV